MFEQLTDETLLDRMLKDKRAFEASVSFCKNKDLIWRWWLQRV